MAGRIWTPMEAGTTFPAKVRFGSRRSRWTRALIHTIMGTGLGIRVRDTFGRRVTVGAGRRSVVATGRSGTVSAGVGFRDQAAVLAAGVTSS
jgi:hypothetical protein